MMHLILLNLRDQIRKKEEAQKESNPVQESEEQEQENSPSPVPKKRRQESREVLQPIDQNCQGEPGMELNTVLFRQCFKTCYYSLFFIQIKERTKIGYCFVRGERD